MSSVKIEILFGLTIYQYMSKFCAYIKLQTRLMLVRIQKRSEKLTERQFPLNFKSQTFTMLPSYPSIADASATSLQLSLRKAEIHCCMPYSINHMRCSRGRLLAAPSPPSGAQYNRWSLVHANHAHNITLQVCYNSVAMTSYHWNMCSILVQAEGRQVMSKHYHVQCLPAWHACC